MGMLSHARKKKARQLGLAANNLGIANKGRGRQKLRKQRQEEGIAAVAQAVERKYAEMKGKKAEERQGGRRQRVKARNKNLTVTKRTPITDDSINVIHEVVYCDPARKASTLMDSLLQLLGGGEKKRPQILIIVSNRESSLRLEQFFGVATVLQALHQPSVASLHEDTPEAERKSVVADFWMKRTVILVVTEKSVDQVRIPRYVVNFDFPPSVADYTARATRLGKVSRDATMISLLTPAEIELAPGLIQALRAKDQFISRELLDAAIEHLEKKLGQE